MSHDNEIRLHLHRLMHNLFGGMTGRDERLQRNLLGLGLGP